MLNRSSEYFNQLLEFIKVGKLSEVEPLIKQHTALANEVDVNSNTLMHFAVINKQAAIAKLLIEYGFPSNNTNAAGYLPIHFASEQGSIELVQLLIAQYPDSIYKSNMFSETPLHIAVFRQHHEVVKTILQNDSNLDNYKSPSNHQNALLKSMLSICTNNYPQISDLLCNAENIVTNTQSNNLNTNNSTNTSSVNDSTLIKQHIIEAKVPLDEATSTYDTNNDDHNLLEIKCSGANETDINQNESWCTIL